MRTMYTLEGNIAAGKSCLGRALRDTGALAFLEEPVDRWRTAYPDNLLDLYYAELDKRADDETNRWAFTLQIMAFVTRAKTWDEILAMTDHSRILMERSVFSDRYIFAKLLYQNCDMTATEYQLYCELWDFMAGQWAVVPHRTFYLRTPAEACLGRIAKRARPEEAGVSLDFLARLETLHDDWLLGQGSAVVVLDGLKSTDDLVADVVASIFDVLLEKSRLRVRA